MINRTQIEIDEQNDAFMIEVQELNKDMHDNCDLNACKECVCIDMRTSGKLRTYEIGRR